MTLEMLQIPPQPLKMFDRLPSTPVDKWREGGNPTTAQVLLAVTLNSARLASESPAVILNSARLASESPAVILNSARLASGSPAAILNSARLASGSPAATTSRSLSLSHRLPSTPPVR